MVPPDLTEHAALQGHPLFRQAAPEERRQLIALGRHEVVAPRTLLFQHNDPYLGPYLLLDGVVALQRTTYNGRQIVLYLARQGDTFCEAPAFEGPSPRRYPATAETMTACELLHFPAEPFARFIQTRASLARAMLTHLAHHLRRQADHLEHVALYTVRGRLARYLLDQAGGRDHATVQLDIPKATLAAHLGTIPETFSRTLHGLADEGLIALDREAIRLVDRPALTLLAEGEPASRPSTP